MTTRIIGLGNPVLTDDGVGIYAARELARRLADSGPEIEIAETEVAGFGLMELLSGCDRAILIDAIQFDDREPGTVVRIEPQDLRTSLRLRSVHEIDLPTVLALGRSLGLRMPGEVIIYGIQSQDSLTLGESLTPPVSEGLRHAVGLILAELNITACATRRIGFNPSPFQVKSGSTPLRMSSPDSPAAEGRQPKTSEPTALSCSLMKCDQT